MPRAPITRQRSLWRTLEGINILGVQLVEAERNVRDGVLKVLVGEEPMGWHLSISHTAHNGKLTRYPHWDEIAEAREYWLPLEVGFVMHLPAVDQYIALHDTCFHLHEHPERTITP